MNAPFHSAPATLLYWIELVQLAVTLKEPGDANKIGSMCHAAFLRGGGENYSAFHQASIYYGTTCICYVCHISKLPQFQNIKRKQRKVVS